MKSRLVVISPAIFSVFYSFKKLEGAKKEAVEEMNKDVKERILKGREKYKRGRRWKRERKKKRP